METMAATRDRRTLRFLQRLLRFRSDSVDEDPIARIKFVRSRDRKGRNADATLVRRDWGRSVSIPVRPISPSRPTIADAQRPLSLAFGSPRSVACCVVSRSAFVQFLWCLAALVCAPLASRAQTVLFVASGGGSTSQLYRVDPTDASSVLVGDILAGTTQLAITGLAFHPLTGVLYGVTGSEYTPSRQLVSIDPLTAEATLIGTGLGFGSSDISFASDGTLYSWTTHGGPLGSIDLVTGVQTQIGSAANGSAGSGLAFTPGGTLYTIGPTEPGDVFSVNTSTGAITSVATLSGVPVGFGNVNAMASDPSGTLFAVSRSNPYLLLKINPTNGVTTVVGTLPFSGSDSLAFGFNPIPEPATTALLLSGLAVFGATMVRRKRAGRAR